MKPIVKVPNSVLTTPAKPITSFDKKTERLIAEMKSTLIATKNPKGVGLAAPQIGEPYRVFITRPHEKDPIRIFVNPEIVKQSENATDGVPERDNKLEGCLSIPTIWGKVSRAKSITLKFQDETGTTRQETFTGFIATIIQHETDHINGILFTYRVLEQKGKFYQSAIDEEGKDILEEVDLQ
jgi:peptide deformylase